MAIDKDLLKDSLTTEDINKIVTSLNGEIGKPDPKGNPVYSTICHNGCNHKMYYYDNSKQFNCYTQCNHFDVYELVIKAKETQGYTYSFYEAIKWVSETVGKSPQSNNTVEHNKTIVDDLQWLNRFRKKPKPDTELQVYDEAVLEVFMPYPHEAWLEEITYETQMKYGIRYYFKSDQIIIPHYSHDNKLIGIRSRNLDEEALARGAKYIPTICQNVQYSHPLSRNLYGLNKNKENIKRLKKICLYEGEKSVMITEDSFSNNNFSVAVCGSSISNEQKDQILSLGVNEVFIAFDKFRAQKEHETEDMYTNQVIEYQQKLIRLAQMFTPFVQTYIIYDMENLLDAKDAPCDKGKGIFEHLMRNKIEINTKDEMLEV